MSVIIFDSCDTLSIYLFYKVAETGNPLYLVDGYFEGKELKVKEDLSKIWKNIYEEYCDLTDSNESFRIFQLQRRIVELETRHIMCNAVILQLLERPKMNPEIMKEYIEVLREWKCPYRSDNFDMKSIDAVKRYLKGAENEIGLKQSELENLTKKGDPVPLIKQVVMAEQALGRNKIDPKKTSVSKWVYMMDVIREKNTSKKNG